MSTILIQFELRVDGVPTDADALPTLADADGTYGIKRLDTGEVVVASGTVMTSAGDGTGQYRYAFSTAIAGVPYGWVRRSVVSGQVIYDPGSGTAPNSGVSNEQREKWFISIDPVDSVVSWADAKAHLRLDSDDEQSYVTSLTTAAVDFAEDSMVIALAARTITANFYNGEPIILPRTPLIEIVSVTDADSHAFTEGAEDFSIVQVGHQTRLVFDSVSTYPIQVVYRAGFPNVARVKRNIWLAILQHVSHLYENRESTLDRTKIPVPHALEAFYQMNRRAVGVG